MKKMIPMRNSILSIFAVTTAVFLSSCGADPTVSITPGGSGKTYSKVVVRDFSCKVANAGESAKKITTAFSNEIVSSVSSKGAFTSVSKNGKITPDTLIITGAVTDYEEGNAGLRFVVGMGAGKAYFVSDVTYLDGATNKTVGTMNVDQAIAAGGVIGATAKPENLVKEAAVNVANESLKFSKNTKNQ